MRKTELIYYFSHPRINRYSIATSSTNKRTLKLYKANLKISQAFHPLLGVTEVVLRNRLNEILSNHFSDFNWIINQKTGFMNDPSLSPKYSLKNQVLKVENHLSRSGISITNGKVISDLTFGFWTEFFEAHIFRLISGTPTQIFKHLPIPHDRKNIAMELNNIRKFRNRINHNEPICFNGHSIDFTSTLNVHDSIINVLSWIDPKLLRLTKELDKVQLLITNAKRI